ncbi:hypothetical protein F5B19DRAFT_160985, partial [Rostrohypoxylon terebratum]
IRKKARTTQKARKGDKPSKTHLSVDELFCSLRKVLFVDTLCFVFPYLKMIRTQWECLERVRAACQPLVDEVLGSRAYDPRKPSHLVSRLLLASAGGQSPKGSNSEILEKAAQAMNEFTSSSSAEEAHKYLRDTIGMTYTRTDTYIMWKHLLPPEPSNEEVSRLRAKTKIKDLFVDRS